MYKALLNHKTRPKYLEIIKLLLENGANINLGDEFGHVCSEDIDKCSELIELFAEYGYAGPFLELIDQFVEEEQKPNTEKNNKIKPLQPEQYSE